VTGDGDEVTGSFAATFDDGSLSGSFAARRCP
jgi:hypothetical protein